MDTDIVNFTEYMKLFHDVLTGTNKTRIITIDGQPLSGKTMLVSRYQALCKDVSRHCALINLRSLADPHGILDYASEQYGLDRFSKYWQYSGQVAMGQADVNFEKSFILFSKLRVWRSQHPNALALYRQLGIRFFQDFLPICSNGGAVWIFDNYDEASEDCKNWMQEDLLPRVHRSPKIVAVIAGRSILPLPVEFKTIHYHISLNGISVEHWEEYTQKLGIPLNRSQIELLHSALDGIPGLMITKLQQLQAIKS